MRRVSAGTRIILSVLLELACIASIIIGVHFIPPIHLSPPVRGLFRIVSWLVLVAVMVISVWLIIWSVVWSIKILRKLIHRLKKIDAVYVEKHHYLYQSKKTEDKQEIKEKRKRQPAYWETWPKKKKRGLPPDQGGVG